MNSIDKITKNFTTYTLNLQGNILEMNNTLIMGILNITEDSFFDGGKYTKIDSALQRAQEIIEQGADIIDIGACSTRPGAQLIPKKEELFKLLPVVKKIREKYPQTLISVDTVWASVAEAVIGEGANIINDISAGEFDTKLFDIVAKLKVPYILMHSPSPPENMQNNTTYNNIYIDMCTFFSKKIDLLKDKGVNDIILDVGFGFGKTIEQNFELLNKLEQFHIFGLPLLTGISRKSMIYRTLNTNAQEALNGTSFLHAFALMNGTQILRVHDVKEAKECLKLFKMIQDNKKQEICLR